MLERLHRQQLGESGGELTHGFKPLRKRVLDAQRDRPCALIARRPGARRLAAAMLMRNQEIDDPRLELGEARAGQLRVTPDVARRRAQPSHQLRHVVVAARAGEEPKLQRRKHSA